jgi:hypothetical protein
MQRRVFFAFSIFVIAVVYLVYIDYLENVPNFSELRMKILPAVTTRIVTNPPSVTPESDQKFSMVYEKQRKNDSRIYMLFWSHYFGLNDWGHGIETMTEEYFKDLECPETNCVFTHKTDLMPNIYDFDAVIFNIWEKDFSLPKLRSPHQLYIMISNE